MPQNKTTDISYVNDFQTPVWVGEYMASLIPSGSRFLLEPTPGLMQLVNILIERGYDVTAPADYWLLDKTQRYDCIVANLPFSSKTFFNCPPQYDDKGMVVAYDTMRQLMSMSDNSILLMPWFTISDSDVRLRMLKAYGLISVTPLPRKTFQYARIQTCILQLQKGYIGNTEFKLNFFDQK